ncbi:hypothetical protein QBC33DRAFT_65410 [Phialemonium atrogriseum]|uniref:Uncharacterized protein n=1 Tax=Phialemonium atrogriseum TaxID=1093897 RepID=A0AAJ0FG74_9PEZI|nr:uncharacterized protein QBC33DRAFT_65410 [Phialemonium atrogriseum]KAK1767321.1 hypothetical protein QBC33DRAFT_65410 [Phialemonium atrogriseum]
MVFKLPGVGRSWGLSGSAPGRWEAGFLDLESSNACWVDKSDASCTGPILAFIAGLGPHSHVKCNASSLKPQRWPAPDLRYLSSSTGIILLFHLGVPCLTTATLIRTIQSKTWMSCHQLRPLPQNAALSDHTQLVNHPASVPGDRGLSTSLVAASRAPNHRSILLADVQYPRRHDRFLRHEKPRRTRYLLASLGPGTHLRRMWLLSAFLSSWWR